MSWPIRVKVVLNLSDSDISFAMVSISGRKAFAYVHSSHVDMTGWQPRSHISLWYALPRESQRVAMVFMSTLTQDSAEAMRGKQNRRSAVSSGKTFNAF